MLEPKEKKVIHAAMHIIESGEDLAKAEFWEGEEMRRSVELLLSQYAEQYKESMDILKYGGFLEKNKPPAFEKVMNTFTPEQLELVSELQEPRLLVIPVTSFGTIIQAINLQEMEGQKDTYVNEDIFGDPGPWSEEVRYWRTAIVEGAEEMEVKKWDDVNTNLKERIKKCQAERKNTLLKGIDRDIYAMLMLESIIKGQPIDWRTCTILDGDDALDLSYSSKVPLARFSADIDDDGDKVAFYGAPSADINSFARFRSVIEGNDLIS